MELQELFCKRGGAEGGGGPVVEVGLECVDGGEGGVGGGGGCAAWAGACEVEAVLEVLLALGGGGEGGCV